MFLRIVVPSSAYAVVERPKLPRYVAGCASIVPLCNVDWPHWAPSVDPYAAIVFLDCPKGNLLSLSDEGSKA